MLIELHEDEVPDLDVAILVAVFGTSARPELRTLVPKDLRTRPTWTRSAHLPVIVLVEALEPLGGNPYFIQPNRRGFVIAEMHGDPQTLRGEAQNIDDELPRPGNGLRLEVVTKTKIAHHLEEGEMTAGTPYLVKVVVFSACSHTFLNSHGPIEGCGLFPGEVGLERNHPRHGEKQGRVVGNKARGPLVAMAALREERRESTANFVGLHERRSLSSLVRHLERNSLSVGYVLGGDGAIGCPQRTPSVNPALLDASSRCPAAPRHADPISDLGFGQRPVSPRRLRLVGPVRGCNGPPPDEAVSEDKRNYRHRE